jgi:hypothetical protein
MNALFDHEAKQSRLDVATAINPITSCRRPLRHPVDTRVAGLCWPRPATAMRTVLRCIATTAARGAASIPSVASTSHQRGVRYVLPSCVRTRCACAARRMGALSRQWSPTTCSRSRTAARGLTGATCKPCASPVTTQRLRPRPPDAADAPDGRGGRISTDAQARCVREVEFLLVQIEARGAPPPGLN